MSVDPIASLRAALVERPVLVFLAGPNGAGKTTFFEMYLERLGLPFVNADRIARLLRDANPEAAPDVIDQQAFTEAENLRRALLDAGLSFCTETVFSDPAGAKLVFLQQATAAGYFVVLVFIGVEGPALSVARVAQRVLVGGHDVPDEKLRERFPRTMRNLRAAVPTVDEAFLLDNSSATTPFRVVAVYRGGRLVNQHPPLPAWTQGLPGGA